MENSSSNAGFLLRGGANWEWEFGEQVGVNRIQHVVFKWMVWEAVQGSEELCNVTSSFCGGAEKGWAGCPSHLEGGRDH